MSRSQPDSASAHARNLLPQGITYLDEQDAVWTAMLRGWAAQQTSRNLSFQTISARRRIVEAFRRSVDDYPWAWTVQQVDEFFLDLRGVKRRSHSTVLGYQNALQLLLAYLTDPAYGWAEECWRRFSNHPAQVFHEWNTARHTQEAMGGPGKRPFTRDELQDLFDCADERVMTIRRSGKKGWIPAFRIATLMKVAYAWGLRRNEVRSLELADMGYNPQARQFGDLGIIYVRFGKAMRGSPPKRRSVLTVPEFEWAADCLREWLDDIRPAVALEPATTFWPSEKGGGTLAITADAVSREFKHVLREAGLDDSLDFHSLRRSYATHLIEYGYDARFVQEQLGHEHGSTTSIYVGVSPDYRQRTVNNALKNFAARLSDSESESDKERGGKSPGVTEKGNENGKPGRELGELHEE